MTKERVFMKKNNKIIIVALTIFMILCALPIVLFSVKLGFSKKGLHIDNKRYEYVNRVCIEEKAKNQCELLLREDLNILLYAHKKNKEYISVPLSISRPDRILNTMYKEQENISVIEPEILLKTMMLKNLLYKDEKKHINAGLFAQKMEEYVLQNFSKNNRTTFLQILESQDENFEKSLKKMKYRKQKRERAEQLKRSVQTLNAQDDMYPDENVQTERVAD